MLFLKGLFGGGSWGLYLLGAAIIAAFWLERGHMQDRITELKGEVTAANTAKDSAIQGQLSLARTNGRRANQDAASEKEEDAINALPVTHNCAQSKPVLSVVGRMFDSQGDTASGDTDKRAVQLPSDASGPKP